ncbi:MAG TPA: leucine-rich repeat domain-containing protein [Sedimentisphaerales bacterium]|nr:leucine-rich repeat domain-containing protein [Sedimentisphaerales bacterium]
MRKGTNSGSFLAAVVCVLLCLLGFWANSALGQDEVPEEIRRMLSELPEIEDDDRPDISDELKDYIVAMQPASGNALLAIISDPEDVVHRRAANAFLQTWASMSAEQIGAYLRYSMTAYTRLRPQYPQGAEAYVGGGYTIRYGWGGWPVDKDVKIRTSSYKILDGQVGGMPHGGLDGKPFDYEGPMAGTGGIPVAELGLGRHTVQAVTDYEVTYKGVTYTGTVKSEAAVFEIIAAEGLNELAAPDDPELNELVRGAFRFVDGGQPIEYLGRREDAWEPQISSNTKGSADEYALCMPGWELTEALPVDLCFKVELHLEQSGEVIEGDSFVVIKGEKRSDYFLPHYVIDFAKIKEGFISLRIVLRPSYEVALSNTRVTQYYNGTLTSGVLRAKTYWFEWGSAKPWERELKTMFLELKESQSIDEQIFYQIESLASLNPYRRAHGAVGLRQGRDKDRMPAVPFLVKLLAGAETDLEIKARENAEKTLVAIGTPAVGALIAALEDENSAVRESAAYILGSIADPGASVALIKALRDGEPAVREAAAGALGQIRDARAVEPLTEALNDYDTGVRDTAAWALRLIQNELRFKDYRLRLAYRPVAVGEFPDSNLEKAVRAAVSKARGKIEAGDLVSRGFIVLRGESCQIRDLRGLEHCTDLIELRLANNQIQDISPLMALKKLTDLSLGRNKIADGELMALAGLTNLERLYLDDGQMSDITPLASLSKLSRLQIGNNRITDISPLSYLRNMTSLWLGGNQIVDLRPLAGLKELEGLSLANNRISDVGPLASLWKLSHLDLKGNQLTDLPPLPGLANLTYLYLDENQISDIGPLSEPANLTMLGLQKNRIRDISPLSSLRKLDSLELAGNQISDLRPLSNLVELKSLSLSKNPIEDIGPLAGLTSLTRLDIAGVQMTDISALSSLTRLSALNLSDNKVSDISVLANFENLTYLYLGSNEISDIKVLSKLSKLKAVWLQGNRITDIRPLVENNGISEGASVNLGANPLSEESIKVHIPALKARGVKVHTGPWQM